MSAITADGKEAIERVIEKYDCRTRLFAKILENNQKSSDFLREFYSIRQISDFIFDYFADKIDSFQGNVNVALQFPDELISDSPSVVEELENALEQKIASSTKSPLFVQFFIIGDNSAGACCSDLTTCNHFESDLLIQFGFSCLQQLKKNEKRTTPTTLSYSDNTSSEVNYRPVPVVHVLGDSSTFLPTSQTNEDAKILLSFFKDQASQQDANTTTHFIIIYDPIHWKTVKTIGNELEDELEKENSLNFDLQIAGLAKNSLFQNFDQEKDEKFIEEGLKTIFPGLISDYSKKICFSDKNQTIWKDFENCGLRFQLPKEYIDEILLLQKPSAEEQPKNPKNSVCFVYIGENDQYFLQWRMEFCDFSLFSNNNFEPPAPNSIFTRYDLLEHTTVPQNFKLIQRAINKRLYQIEWAKDSKIFGILITNPTLKHTQTVLKLVESWITKAGKNFVKIFVGKVNVAKLANFTEVDSYVLIDCPMQTTKLIASGSFNYASVEPDFYGNADFNLSTGGESSKPYLKPIITPFELAIALQEREWDGSYITSTKTLVDCIFSSENKELQQKHSKNEEDDGSIVDFSFISGNLVRIREKKPIDTPQESSENKPNEERSLMKSETTIAKIIEDSPAFQFFQNRSYHGLDSRIGQDEVQKGILQGRSGRAKGYENEKNEL